MWERIWNFCKRSHTIAWAWLHMVIGGLATAISFIEPQWIEALVTPTTFSLYVALNGAAIKWLRQYKATDL